MWYSHWLKENKEKFRVCSRPVHTVQTDKRNISFNFSGRCRNSRWIWGVHLIQATKKGKPRTDVTISSKHKGKKRPYKMTHFLQFSFQLFFNLGDMFDGRAQWRHQVFLRQHFEYWGFVLPPWWWPSTWGGLLVRRPWFQASREPLTIQA